jgi:hypothetical protein
LPSALYDAVRQTSEAFITIDSDRDRERDSDREQGRCTVAIYRPAEEVTLLTRDLVVGEEFDDLPIEIVQKRSEVEQDPVLVLGRIPCRQGLMIFINVKFKASGELTPHTHCQGDGQSGIIRVHSIQSL